MRVLITGGAGFIGTNLTLSLVHNPHFSEIRIMDDFSTGSLSGLSSVPDVEVIEGTILDMGLLKSAAEGVDSIVHLAARPSVPRSITEPRLTHEVNTTGTMNVLEVARTSGNIHTIVASSSSVYGNTSTFLKHEDLAPRPLSPYAVSKLTAESYALAWQYSFGVPVLVFRFFNVYGPRQASGHAYSAAIPAFVEAALEGREIPLHGDGSQSRDFTFVDTVVDAITQCLVSKATHTGPINLAFGSSISLIEVIKEIEAILGGQIGVQHLPERVGDVKHSHADSRRLKELLPQLQTKSFSEGLRITIDWFRSERP